MKDKEEPSIEMAMAIAKKFGKAIVIVLTIEEAGQLTMHSWGKDKPSCDAGANLGEMCFKNILLAFKNASELAEADKPAKEKLFTPRIITPNEGN